MEPNDLQSAFASLFKINMGLSEGEKIIVFSDTIRPDEDLPAYERDRRIRLHATAIQAALYADSNFGNAGFYDFPATSASGAEPPEGLWIRVFGEQIVAELREGNLLTTLLKKEVTSDELELAAKIVSSGHDQVADVVVAMSNNSTSHTRFRHLVNVAGGRFASLPHFDPEMFFTSMAVDWHALAERTRILETAINEAVRLIISTPNGTHLSLSKVSRTAQGDNGLLAAPGSFGNLPAGEVYLAPLEGTAEGVLVIEYAPTRKLVTPLKLTVCRGEVTEIHGEEPHSKWLSEKFAENRKNRNIAELGIGTNDRASRPDNILEAEKILGTIHVALGDNSGFGGVVSTQFHEDYLFYHPTLIAIMADGGQKPVLIDGKMLV